MIGSAYRRMWNVLRKHTDIRYSQRRSNTYGFIVLLPEVDPEFTENLLSVNDELPAFSKITTEKIGTLMGKEIVDYECAVRNADRKLEEVPDVIPDLFNDFLNPLERTINEFDTIWGLFGTLYLCDRTKVPPNTYSSLSNRIMNARTTLFNTECIFEACKKCDKSKLTEEQARLVDKILLEGRLNGLDSPPRKKGRLQELMPQLIEHMTYFRMRADAARDQFLMSIEDPLLVQEVPRNILRKMSNVGGGSVDGPWTLKLHFGLGEKYLEYCPDRSVRFTIWHAEDKAASLAEADRKLTNSVCLEEIRHDRHELAECAGYKNYVESRLTMTMAGSLENIQNTFKSYLKVAKPAQLTETLKLQELALSFNNTFPMQLWDIPYWSRKMKRVKFNFDDELLRPFLPLDRVLSGLFDLCSRLFGLRVEEVKDVERWHPDVRFFYVFEPECEKPAGGLYFDPYIRNTKMMATSSSAIASPIRSSSGFPRRTMPLAALTMYLEPPSEKLPCLLSFSEAKELFSVFGSCLQTILNKSSYSDIAGLNFVEFDALETVPLFMSDWIYDEKTFKSISQNYETGEPAPALDLESVRKHMAGYRLCKDMFKAHMDIEMHTNLEKFWLDIATDLWDDYYIFPMSKFFSDPCRYHDIFCERWGGIYYSHLWAEMVAADIRRAFVEENNSESVGARFRDTFLTFGGSCHASEVFRRFRGRDPNPQILLEHLGLQGGVDNLIDNKTTEDPKLVASC